MEGVGCVAVGHLVESRSAPNERGKEGRSEIFRLGNSLLRFHGHVFIFREFSRNSSCSA